MTTKYIKIESCIDCGYITYLGIATSCRGVLDRGQFICGHPDMMDVAILPASEAGDPFDDCPLPVLEYHRPREKYVDGYDGGATPG